MSRVQMTRRPEMEPEDLAREWLNKNAKLKLSWEKLSPLVQKLLQDGGYTQDMYKEEIWGNATNQAGSFEDTIAAFTTPVILVAIAAKSGVEELGQQGQAAFDKAVEAGRAVLDGAMGGDPGATVPGAPRRQVRIVPRTFGGGGGGVNLFDFVIE